MGVVKQRIARCDMMGNGVSPHDAFFNQLRCVHYRYDNGINHACQQVLTSFFF